MTETPTQPRDQEAAPSPPPADTALPGLLTYLPGSVRPYALLARWDRPVGIWLLFLPCLIGLAQMRLTTGFRWPDLVFAILFFVGAIAMRGAGCTWNDLLDRDFDAQVARTKDRPLPSGQIRPKEAYAFLGSQVAVGFLVWLALPGLAKIVTLFALPLVAAYPFMKRLTWWPQAWLGFTFNWGALVGGTAVYGGLTGANVVLYLGLAAWTVAYDTIYALQDAEDDAMIGVRSTARLFGQKVLTGIFSFHLVATLLIAIGLSYAGGGRLAALTAIAFLCHGLYQVAQLRGDPAGRALSVFKQNVWAGVILAGGIGLAVLL